MTMLRFILYVAVLGALLNVAKCDFKCFVEKLKVLDDELYLFFGDNRDQSCLQSGQKEFIDSLQHSIDECSVPVTTDSMKSLIQELCNPHSDLYQTLDQNADCLFVNHFKGAFCQPVHVDPTKEGCLQLKRNLWTCSAKAIGEPCGEEAVKALKRIYKTSDSLTEGMCEEITSSSSSSLHTWASVFTYLRWIGLALSVLISIILIAKRVNKKKPSNENQLDCEKQLDCGKV